MLLPDGTELSFFSPLTNSVIKYQPKVLLDENGHRIQSEPKAEFDPLESIRESTKMLQRDIVLKLQKRLGQMVDSGASIEDIHTCTHALGMNIEIHGDIEDIF